MNYSEMTDAELDRLSADIVKDMVWDTGQCFVVGIYNKRWQPTHPDSNQAERYLFPKLLDAWAEIYEQRLDGVYSIYMMCNDDEDQINGIDLPINSDQINRTKVIACLEAHSKLKGE